MNGNRNSVFRHINSLELINDSVNLIKDQTLVEIIDYITPEIKDKLFDNLHDNKLIKLLSNTSLLHLRFYLNKIYKFKILKGVLMNIIDKQEELYETFYDNFDYYNNLILFSPPNENKKYLLERYPIPFIKNKNLYKYENLVKLIVLNSSYIKLKILLKNIPPHIVIRQLSDWEEDEIPNFWQFLCGLNNVYYCPKILPYIKNLSYNELIKMVSIICFEYILKLSDNVNLELFIELIPHFNMKQINYIVNYCRDSFIPRVVNSMSCEQMSMIGYTLTRGKFWLISTKCPLNKIKYFAQGLTIQHEGYLYNELTRITSSEMLIQIVSSQHKILSFSFGVTFDIIKFYFDRFDNTIKPLIIEMISCEYLLDLLNYINFDIEVIINYITEEQYEYIIEYINGLEDMNNISRNKLLNLIQICKVLFLKDELIKINNLVI